MGHGALGRRTRVALVAAPARGIGTVADHHQRGLGAEGVEPCRSEIRPQQEIGLGHVAPARKLRAVDQQARGQRFRVDRAGVAGDVAPTAGKIGEAEVDYLHARSRDPLQDRLSLAHRRHPGPASCHGPLPCLAQAARALPFGPAPLSPACGRERGGAMAGRRQPWRGGPLSRGRRAARSGCCAGVKRVPAGPLPPVPWCCPGRRRCAHPARCRAGSTSDNAA